jgi:hypothetical protein
VCTCVLDEVFGIAKDTIKAWVKDEDVLQDIALELADIAPTLSILGSNMGWTEDNYDKAKFDASIKASVDKVLADVKENNPRVAAILSARHVGAFLTKAWEVYKRKRSNHSEEDGVPGKRQKVRFCLYTWIEFGL